MHVARTSYPTEKLISAKMCSVSQNIKQPKKNGLKLYLKLI